MTVAVVVCLLLVAAWPAGAGTLKGSVRNGTTGTPAAGVDVVLISLAGGMETVANTKTDATGQFAVDHAGIGTQPMLVRVVYRGVNFHANLPPGRTSAEIEVFDVTSDPKSVAVTQRMVVFQPNGAQLLVGEEYAIVNQTKPPLAYFSPQGTFEFELPEGAELNQVSAWGPSGMPTTQGTIGKGKGREAIAFAFRPGESGVRLSYQMGYIGNQARVRTRSPIGAERVVLIAPPSVQVNGEGFVPAGMQEGWSVYTRGPVAANASLSVSLSGTVPPPSEASGQSSGNEAAASQAIQVMPNRLGQLQWVLVVGFGALFAIGVTFLWRRPAAAAAGAGESPSGAATHPARKAQVAGLEQLDRAVRNSLEELKDTLFRLELRRQAGTISEDEYRRERTTMEEKLKAWVKG